MRTIKFRAGWKPTKRMVYNVGLRQSGTPFAVEQGGYYELESDKDLDGYELMQFTGLKDKNGKEIYEYDIVRLTGTGDREGDDLGTKTVKWQSDACGFFFQPSMEAQSGDYTVLIGAGETEEFELEVIGNIYENPELLPQKG
jgi:uncharacterized phage protein (TIGR01671 family)